MDRYLVIGRLLTYSVDKESKKRGTLLKLELIPRFLAF